MVDGLPAFCKKTREFPVHMEIRRKCRQRHRNLCQQILADTGGREYRNRIALLVRQRPHLSWHKMVDTFLKLLKSLFHSSSERLLNLDNFRLTNNPFSSEPLGIEFPRRRMVPNFLIEERLCIAGIVRFVVPVAPVTKHVNDDVLFESLAIFKSNGQGSDGSFWIISIH